MYSLKNKLLNKNLKKFEQKKLNEIKFNKNSSNKYNESKMKEKNNNFKKNLEIYIPKNNIQINQNIEIKVKSNKELNQKWINEIKFNFEEYKELIKEFTEIKELSNKFKYINFKIKYQKKNKRFKNKNKEKNEIFIQKRINKETIDKINLIKSNCNNYIQKNKEISEYDKTLLKIRSQLNKITPENYNWVLNNLRIYINQNEYSKKLIKNLIEKAWNEHIYASSYANLLLDIIKIENKPTIKIIKNYVIKLTNKKFSLGYKNFKNELDEKNKENVSDIIKNEFISVYKNSLLGNINFICELFILNFFKPKIIKNMISELINNIIVEFNKYLDNRENLLIFETNFQGLIRIFEYCGKEISLKLNKFKFKKLDRNETYKYFESIKTRINNKDKNYYKHIYHKEKDIKIDYEKLVFDFFEFIKNVKNFPLRILLLIENIVQYKESNYEEDIIKFKKPKKLNEINNNLTTNNNNKNELNEKSLINEDDNLLNEYNKKLSIIFEEDNIKNNNNWFEEFKKIYYEIKYEDLNYEDRVYKLFFLNSTPRKQNFYDLIKNFLNELFEKNYLIDKELFYLINCFYVENYDNISELILFQKFLIDLIYNLYKKGYIEKENFTIDFANFYKENYYDIDNEKEEEINILKIDLIRKFNKYFKDNRIENVFKLLLK